MILHLKDKSKVGITRKTCAHYIPDKYDNNGSCNWNINPIEIISDKESGYFAIGKWGCDFHRNNSGVYIRTPENFEQLIPIHSVIRITEIGVW